MSLKPKVSIYIALIPTVQNQPEPRSRDQAGAGRKLIMKLPISKLPPLGISLSLSPTTSAGASATSMLVNLGSFHPKLQVLLQRIFIYSTAGFLLSRVGNNGKGEKTSVYGKSLETANTARPSQKRGEKT